MAMCLRCLQEGKFVDVNDCDHDEPTFSTHEEADEATPKSKKGKN
jgi:hypothetical protein